MSELPSLQNTGNEPRPLSQNNEVSEIAWQKWIERNKERDAALAIRLEFLETLRGNPPAAFILDQAGKPKGASLYMLGKRLPVKPLHTGFGKVFPLGGRIPHVPLVSAGFGPDPQTPPSQCRARCGYGFTKGQLLPTTFCAVAEVYRVSLGSSRGDAAHGDLSENVLYDHELGTPP